MNESKDPGRLGEETASTDDDILDLTEVVENPQEPAQDDVIDLTEVVEKPPDEPSAESEEDGIVDLTEVVDTPPGDSSAENAEDDILDLTDVVEPPEPVEETSQELEEMAAGDSDVEEGRIDDSTDTLEAALPSGSDAPSITPEQLDAAIERVVKEMLSDKIDDILNQVIEREVNKEIDRLKRLLRAEYSDTDDSE